MASPAAQQQRARALKIAEYERFIGERLQPDLLAAEEARARTQREIAQWEGLVANARGLQERGQEELRTMVDLGSQVYCQAEVPDTSRLFVAVGLGFHAEMTLVRATTASLAHLSHRTSSPHEPDPDPSSSRQPQDEAVAFAETKLERLREDEKARLDEVANVQSHVKLVTEGIRELMMLSPDAPAGRAASGFDNASAR